MKKKPVSVFAVQHALGLSIIQARTATIALRYACSHFGDYGGPYRLAHDQPGAIIHAYAMGAQVLEGGS